VPEVVEVIPPNTETPEADGTLGLDWAQAKNATGHGTAIAHGPAGWAYVVLYDGEMPMVPRLRFSDDLRTWTEHRPDDPDMFGGVDWMLAGSDAAYVLGGVGIWWSVDGRHWERGVNVGAGGPVDADRIVSDGRGFVAWRAGRPSNGIWMSADGRTWSALAVPDAPAVIVDAVAALPAGGYVAAGRAAASTAELDTGDVPARLALPGDQAVWSSRDGATWESVPLGAGFEVARIGSIAAGGPGGGIIAVGNPVAVDEESGVEPGVAIWRWLEGTGWQRIVGQGFPTVQRDPSDVRIIATTDRWLLVGSRMRGDARNVLDLTPPAVVAGTEDGTAWWATAPVVLGPETNYVIDAIGSAPGRLVFLTNGGASLEGTVRIWVSPSG
jgi:hypothetical protein